MEPAQDRWLRGPAWTGNADAMSAASPPFTASNPAWVAHRYALTDDSVHFRHVPRSEHGGFPFLTEEYIGAHPAAILPRATAVQSGGAAPLHFIFHSAFCASTLLCRALDRPGMAMGLSEPVILNDIVGIRRRGEVEPRRIGELTDHALRLLARPWEPGEAVVVKPSNILNPLAAGILTLRPEARAVLLHAPLETFLASVARKGMWCRLWVRELLEGYLIDGAVDLGFEAKDYLRQTDLQVAAVGWLAQHALFHGLAARFGGRVATLDSETLTSAPERVLGPVAAHFGLALSSDAARAIATGPIFRRHSKFGTDFSPDDRRREQAEANAAHGEEIAQVAEWARAVAAAAGVAMAQPNAIGAS